MISAGANGRGDVRNAAGSWFSHFPLQPRLAVRGPLQAGGARRTAEVRPEEVAREARRDLMRARSTEPEAGHFLRSLLRVRGERRIRYISSVAGREGAIRIARGCA